MEDASSKIKIRADSCFSTAKTGSYFLELSRLGLWPVSETSRKCSIEQVFSKLSEFQTYSANTLFTPVCSCKTCKADFKDDILRFITDRRRSLKGLCLTCVRAGRASAETGNCQSTSCDKQLADLIARQEECLKAANATL